MYRFVSNNASIARIARNCTNQGRTVVIEQSRGAPKVTKDGVTVAKCIEFKDRVKSIGACLVKQVANATNDVAGDGTTCATVLSRAIIAEGFKPAGMNAMVLRRGISMAVDAAVTNLKSRARMISTSANKERRMGKLRALRQLTLGKGKSAGRNFSGRITIFHRGGGAKRLLRRIDLKRSTSSMGIVESIEYDPNRSSQIAAVRWIKEGSQKRMNTVEEFTSPHKIVEPTTNTISSRFSFSFLPGKVEQRKVAGFSPGVTATCVVDGLLLSSSKSTVASKGIGSRKTLVKDVLSAFSSPNAKRETASLALASSYSFPRIAVAGAKPAFFAPRMSQKVRGESTISLGEVRKWRTERMKDKAGLSWQSCRGQDTVGLEVVGDGGHNKSKRKTVRGSLGVVDRARVSYIIASHKLEAGKMVMNCEWTKDSKPSSSSLLRS